MIIVGLTVDTRATLCYTRNAVAAVSADWFTAMCNTQDSKAERQKPDAVIDRARAGTVGHGTTDPVKIGTSINYLA